jgi:hypothetical protein
MVVAMRSVRMVEMPAHEIVHVVPVRDCRVPAVWAVDMIVRVPATVVIRGASAGVARANGEFVFFYLAVR